MRLLFDEQLSEELCQMLADVYPGSLHIRRLGLATAADLSVWEAAQHHACILVTKDEDFHRLAMLCGAPPKLVWIRLGNCTTTEVSGLLRAHRADIQRFYEHSEATVLELG